MPSAMPTDRAPRNQSRVSPETFPMPPSDPVEPLGVRRRPAPKGSLRIDPRSVKAAYVPKTCSRRTLYDPSTAARSCSVTRTCRQAVGVGSLTATTMCSGAAVRDALLRPSAFFFYLGIAGGMSMVWVWTRRRGGHF